MGVRGRPPMSCDKLNGKIEARVTLKGKTTMRTKCTGRESHQLKPCKLTDNGACKSKSPMKPKSPQIKTCTDANTPRGTKSKVDHRAFISSRCKVADKQLNKKGVTCKVNQKTGRCRNSVVAKDKKKLMLKTGANF